MTRSFPQPTGPILRDPPEGAELVRAIPDGVPMPNLSSKGAPPAAVYEYLNADGSRATLIARYKGVDRKIILPFTLYSIPDGNFAWCNKGLPDNRPLYRLPQMLADPTKTVLISEGEKCADAVVSFKNYASTTWIGGSKALSKTIISPLAGRDVVILPDHDEPGQAAAKQLVQMLSQIGANSVRVLDIARLAQECGLEPQKGFDIADAVEAGLDADRFEALMAMPGMLVDAFARTAEPADDPDNLPEDVVQREVQVQFGIRPDDIPDAFSLSEDGVIKRDVDRNGRDVAEYAGSPLVVLGRTRSARSGWGLMIALRTPEGKWDRLNIPARLLAGDGREMRELLASSGFTLPQSRAGRQALAEYVGYAQHERILDIASRPGWHEGSFALPQQVVHPAGTETEILLDMEGRQHLLRQKGNLEGWQELALHAENNSRAAFAISTAFAAPLLHLLELPGGGFNLFGQSSRGKSTLLTVAGSVWGGGGNDGFVRNWRMTDNGAEGLLSDHNDLLLPLDELTTVAPETAAALYYLLANGHGKVRATREGDARASTQSRVMVLSSGENSAEQQIGLARGKVKVTGGLAVRMLDIPIEHSPGEAFEDLGNFASARHLAERMAVLAKTHYGHAGPAFVRAVIDRRALIIPDAKELISEVIQRMVRSEDDPQVHRAAARFALVGVAGQLATEAGILPWENGSSCWAASDCFEGWRAYRGGGTSHEEREALSHLKGFFETHGRTRFERIRGGAGEEGDQLIMRSDDHAVRDRCGYRVETDGEGTMLYVLPEAFRREVCGGHSPDLLIRILRKNGALIEGEDGRPQKKVRLPDYPNGTRVYALRPDLLP